MADGTNALTIDIVSDTVCPWCLIGKRRLERALALRPALNVDVRWRAFQLHPDLPAEGADRAAFSAAKFGDVAKARAVYERIAVAGEQDGLRFHFDRITRVPNTVDSHRLILWAASAGCQDRVVEGLFAAYFFAGRDISDPDVLCDVARGAGMDADLVGALLAGPRDRQSVIDEDRAARRMGVSGVPVMIVERRFAIQGAQEPEAIAATLDQAAAPAA